MERLTEEPRGGETDHERRLRLVIEAAPSAMLMVDPAGRIVLVNTEAEHAFGYSRDELLALRIEDLIPQRFRTTHERVRSGFFHAPSRRAMGAGRELYGLRKDGSELPIEIGLNPIVIGEDQFVLASVIDITERLGVRAEEEHRLRRSILDSIPFSVIATDPAGMIVSANPGSEQLLGYPREALVGRSLSVVGSDSDTDRLPSSLASRSGSESERDYVRSDGTTVPVTEGITRLRGDDGETTGYLAVAYDITQRKQAQAAVLFMANHDALTNMPNRSMLVRHLVGAIDQAATDGTQVVLVLLDLDHFKRVNDSMGHHAGDVLLLRVADRLKRWIPNAEMVARLGGDEFVIVFTGVRDASALTADVQNLLESLTTPLAIQGTELAITVSAGGVVYPTDGDNPSALLRLADTAMYQAKAAGRNNFAWFAEPMLDESNERASMASALRVAMRSDELAVAYQPQVDLATGDVVGFEALARWYSPVHGPVRPDRFIPVAEDSGMIVELGRWVLEHACHDVAEMQRTLGRRLRVAVNASPRQFHSAGWVQTVVSALESSGLSPDQLELEITEGILMDDRWNVIEVLRALRDLGVSIAVDDFGQGYSSLAYLTRFPIDKLKIDRAFVQEIRSADGDAPIVDAIIGMAHALGMEVVAEGVESPFQEHYLRERGCDQVQGFLYSAALPAAEAVSRAQPVSGA
jgi:diguanylate cyclase (GGDEF)-like protein/PAS domain S-box-containing protein